MRLPVQGPTDGSPGAHDRVRYTAHARTTWGSFLEGVRLAPGSTNDRRRATRMVSARGTVYVMDDFIAGGGFGSLYKMRAAGATAEGEPARFVVKVFDTWEEAVNDVRGAHLLGTKRQGRTPVTEGCVVWPPRALLEAVVAKERQEEFETIVAADPRKERAYIVMPLYNEDLFTFLGRVHAKDRPELSEAEACGVVCAVARAASRLWAAGIMLTDIKAGNVMVHYRGVGARVSIRLVDHGCFKDRTRMGAYNTTFCPPEHVHYYAAEETRVPCEEASLVWQLGILLAHILRPSLQYTTADTYGELFNKWTQSTLLGEAMKTWTEKDAFLRTMGGHVLSVVRGMLRERGASEGLSAALMYALREGGIQLRPTIGGFLQRVEACSSAT